MEEIKKIDIHAHATAFPQFAPPHPATGYRMVCAEEILKFYDKLVICSHCASGDMIGSKTPFSIPSAS